MNGADADEVICGEIKGWKRESRKGSEVRCRLRCGEGATWDPDPRPFDLAPCRMGR